MNPNPEPDDVLPHPGAFLPPSIEDLSALIPAYDFIEFVDRGGMGAVYRARQRSLERIVAVKLLPVVLGNRKAFSERFKREARALALLNHPNIVSVYDFGEASGGSLYYVMEYVKGTNLRHLMREGKTTSRRLLSIAMQVCEALQFAHMHGVVHRDVKPANVLIDERGHVKVADFGLAKVIGPSPVQELTNASDALGTPDYMAPEAVTRQHEVDHRADIYSLGVMLYEMLTGHVPRGAWEPPSRTLGTDSRFDDIVSRALQTDPQKRFQNMGELTSVMKQLVQASGTQTAISSPALDRIPPALDPGATTIAMRAPRRAPRFPRLAMGALSVAAVGGVGFAFLKDQPVVMRIFGVQPEAFVQAAAPTEAERQRALAQFVLTYGGFVNVTTPFQTEKLVGGSADIYSMSNLPKGDFSVWRVTLDDRTFKDEDLAALVRLCEAADTVSNLNLYGSGITAAGVAHITRLSGTLDSLNLRKTRSFTEQSVPFLGACKSLRSIFVSRSTHEAGIAGIETDRKLLDRMAEILPECEVHLE